MKTTARTKPVLPPKPRTLADRVHVIIAEQLGVDLADVTPGADLADDLGADSLDRIELIMSVEEAFDIAIDDDAADLMRKVGDITRHVEGAALRELRK